MSKLEDLQFIKSVIEQLVVDVKTLQVGPAIIAAENQKILAIAKLQKLIVEEKRLGEEKK